MVWLQLEAKFTANFLKLSTNVIAVVLLKDPSTSPRKKAP